MPAQMRKPKAKSKKSKVKKSKPKPKSRLDLDGKLVKFISKIVNETLDKREAQQAQDMSKIFQEEVQQVEKNMKRPKVYTSGDDPNQYLRNVETYADHLEKKSAILVNALEILVKNADDEALVAEDGWDVGNSPDSVQNFAQRALDSYRKD